LAYFDKTSVPLTMSTLALVSTHSLLSNWESKHIQAKYDSPETCPDMSSALIETSNTLITNLESFWERDQVN